MRCLGLALSALALAAQASTSTSSTTAPFTKCGGFDSPDSPGVSLSGLGDGFDGDYYSFYPFGYTLENSIYLFRYFDSSVPPLRNPWLSPEDAARTNGLWTLVSNVDAASGAYCGEDHEGRPCAVLAVCTSGCPMPPDSAGNNAWPADGQYTNMTWTWEDGSPSVAAASLGSCCKRKANSCDACDADTCGVWTLWDLNKCYNPLSSKLRKECCDWGDMGGEMVCGCKAIPSMCDHDTGSYMAL